MDNRAMFSLSYGLFVLSAYEYKHNGCIINTAIQVTSEPNAVSITVNKQNLTHDMIMRTKKFNLSVLDDTCPFEIFTRFGFVSGRSADKLEGLSELAYSENSLFYMTKYACAYISGEVINTVDLGTHTMFIARVTDAETLSSQEPATYAYYHTNIKPKPDGAPQKKGYRCTVCGYVYEGDELPDGFVCPVCKHPASDFEKL